MLVVRGGPGKRNQMPLNEQTTALRERLLEIEAIAQAAYQDSADETDATSRRPKHDLSFEALQLLAGQITGGEVMPRANLYRKDERVAGLLVDKGQYADVLYEEHDPEVRQRFTIGHELGHFHLHRGNGVIHARCLPNRVDGGDEMPEEGILDPEEEADAFSGAFLMPAQELMADVAHFGRCVAFLAARYRVSKRAMNRRLKTVELLYREDRAPL